MRIYSSSYELMSEMGRELNSYGQTVKPKTYQNKNIEGNEDFVTKEIICQQYCLTSLQDPTWLFFYSRSREWADAEFQERIDTSSNPVNPGKAWELRKDLWEQFLVNGKFDYTYNERMVILPYTIQLLKSDSDTRKAVLPIFNGNGEDDTLYYMVINVYPALCIMISLSVRMAKERRYYIFAITKEARTLLLTLVMMYTLHGDLWNMLLRK